MGALTEASRSDLVGMVQRQRASLSALRASAPAQAAMNGGAFLGGALAGGFIDGYFGDVTAADDGISTSALVGVGAAVAGAFMDQPLLIYAGVGMLAPMARDFGFEQGREMAK